MLHVPPVVIADQAAVVAEEDEGWRPDCGLRRVEQLGLLDAVARGWGCLPRRRLLDHVVERACTCSSDVNIGLLRLCRI